MPKAKLSTPCEMGHRMIQVSWTQLRNFEECRQRAKLRREGYGNKMRDQRMFFPGTVTDRVTRDWLRDSPGDLGRMPSMVKPIIERELDIIHSEGGMMKWKSLDDIKKVEADCIEAVTKIEPDLMKYVVPFDFLVDYRFKVMVTVPDPRGGTIDVLLIGAMDILTHMVEQDWWNVFDVKHTRDNQYYKKTQGQLTFYDLVIDCKVGQPTKARALFQPLASPRVKPIELDQALRSQLMGKIADYVAAIILDEFPTLPPTEQKKHCTYCEVKHACPLFAETINDRGQKTLAF